MKKLTGLLLILSFAAMGEDSVKSETIEVSSAASPIQKAWAFELGYTGLENKEEKETEFSEYQGYEFSLRKNYMINDKIGTSTALGFANYRIDEEKRISGIPTRFESNAKQVKVSQRFYYDVPTSADILIRQFAEVSFGMGDIDSERSNFFGSNGTNRSYRTTGLSFGGELVFDNKFILTGRYAFDNAIVDEDGDKIKTKNYSVTFGYAL